MCLGVREFLLCGSLSGLTLDVPPDSLAVFWRLHGERPRCWWCANYMDDDQTKEVKLVIRSLACTRMELHHSRLATSVKLRAEFDRRLDKNSRAVDSLNGNRQLWLTAGGPDPDTCLLYTSPSPRD